jgi:cytochrome d ubiquinol oxidase subunit II
VGGVLFVAFPEVLTTAFPAFYLALHLVLWCFALRGVGIEVRSHVADAMWATLWDAIFAGASVLLALLFGVAFGNIVRGVPLDDSRSFTMALFTNFGTKGQVGLLDYYTLSVGLLAVVLLSAHGAAFLAWRTAGVVRERCLLLERKLWPAVAALFALVTVETAWVRPDLLAHLLSRPLAWFTIAVAFGGVALLVASRRGRLDGHAFHGSCVLVAGVLASAGVGLYPVFLHSTFDARFDFDAFHQARNSISMRFAFGWWPFAFALAVSYVVNVFRANRARAGEDY